MVNAESLGGGLEFFALVITGDYNYGQFNGARALAQLFNQLNSGQAGQLELDQKQIRRLGGNSSQSRDAIALMLDIKALLLETTGNRCSQLQIFFSQQDAHGHNSCLPDWFFQRRRS